MGRRLDAVLVGACVASAALACGGGESSRTPSEARTLLHLKPRLVRGGASVGERVDDPRDARAGGRRERVTLDGVARDAVPAAPPSVWGTRVAAGGSLRLELALGLRGGDAGPVRFRVHAARGGERRSVLDETVGGDDAGAWHERRVELPELGGEGDLVLELETSAGSGERTPAFWGAPLLVARAEPEARAARDAAPPDVVLVSLDTVRADRLSLYGYDRPTSPALERLASEAAVFERAYSQAAYTVPSHVSLFTSLYVDQHRVVRQTALPPGLVTMAEIFRRNGYRAAGFVDGGYMSDEFRMGEGFDEYDERAGGADAVFARAARWLDERSGEPCFLLVHTYEAHAPYAPPEAFRRAVHGEAHGLRGDVDARELRAHVFGERVLGAGDWERIGGLYDAGVAAADDALGRFVEHLRRAGRLDDTVLVVLSDHGEELGDHGGALHGKTLYEEQLRVPLLFRVPARLGASGPRRVDAVVELVDVLPTLVELAGLRTGGLRFEGESLVPLLRGEAGGGDGGAPAVARFVPPHVLGHALVTGRWKYVSVDPPPGPDPRVRMAGEYLFDLRADPAERANRLEAHPEVGAALRRALAERRAAWERWRAGDATGPGVPVESDGALLEELRRLGYVR